MIRRMLLLSLGLLLQVLIFGGGGAGSLRDAIAQNTDATITIDATQPGLLIDGSLWGSNLLQSAEASATVNHAGFVAAARQMGIPLVRWPGGNNADVYDWKRDEQIFPGRRIQDPRLVYIGRMIQFTRDIGAEPSITVNFGTMTARDAADLVEFLNGPADSTWGARRAAMGLPEPLNVRYFEVGNEEHLPHMWYFSWTAENPEKYFFGGEEERRGFYGGSEHDPVGAKGDLFRADGVRSEPRSASGVASDGTPRRYVPDYQQVYPLRFPPVRDVRAFWAASREDAENRVFEEWQQVADLSTQPPDAKVFTLDEEAGLIRFGDGVHGAAPPAGSYFLVEYTTYGHDGFLDFARAMRAAPSSVSIQIGAATLPFVDGQPITDTVRMVEIFQEMDFYVRHQYNASFPRSAYGSYDARRQIAADRVAHLAEVYDRVREYTASIKVTRSLSIGVTEWNVFLNEDYWHINRTLEGGVIAAEWFIRLMNAGQTAPVAYANQFALHGGNLALIRTQTNYSIAPMGYVFQGFADWPGSRVVSTTVTSPEAMAYDRMVPYVAAAAALSADGRTLRIAAVNNAGSTPVTATLQIAGFTPSTARLWRLSADSYAAGNDREPANVALTEEPVQVPLDTVTLPPHSVTFLELSAPSQEECVGDANGNGVGDVVDIEATAAGPGCQVYLPLVAANWRRPWPTPGSATVYSDLTQAGSSLPALLEPSANLHPMWGDRNEDPIAWWQEQVPRWQEGTYFFFLDLWHIEEGSMNLAQGRYPDTLTGFAGPEANAFVGITRVPASLEPIECRQPDSDHPRWVGRCAPTSYEAYQQVLEALVTYLSVPDVVMPENQATQILGIAGRSSLGLDGLNYIFWHEINAGQWNWRDGPAAWFQLYDYWIAAVRAVRAAYPEVRFTVGTNFQGDNHEDGHPGPQVEHSELLDFLQNLFLPFLNGRASERIPDYEYRADPPLDLDFYALNPRRNENHFWLNDWDDSDGDGEGFYTELTGVFSGAGLDDLPFVGWALQSGHLQVEAPLLPQPPPGKDEIRYWGAERDSEMGAAAQVALQHDAARSPVIPLAYAWAEFLSDSGWGGVNETIPYDYPLYRGDVGNAFTYAYYAKPTYNVMRMLGMQETIRVPAQITDGVSPAKRNYVGAVVTRDETGEHVVVLLWYYIPPEDLESAAGRRYEDLRAYADTHLRVDLEVVLEGLGDGPYRLARYLVDETHSNGFHYRQTIADAKAPAEEVNGWLPGNNPYDASVALEQVEERESVPAEGGAVRLGYAGVTPWTVMLIDLRPAPDPVGDGLGHQAQ